MSRAQIAPEAQKSVYFDTPNLYVRTLTIDDATERWASWFDQEEVRQGLNLSDGPRTKAAIADYIRKFDQVSNLLLGIFDRTNHLLVGMFTVQIDWQIGRYLTNTVVGEAEYRHRGVMLEVTPPYRDYFFEELGLRVMTASALATNKPIIGYLYKTGWTLNQTLRNHARSAADGSPVDLHLFSITREAWHAWKAANPEQLEAMRNGRLR
jgi:RimJ/RimL family protein N-acetyltransferase